MYNFSFLFLGQWVLLEYLLNLPILIRNSIHCEDTVAILRIQFSQILINCLLLVALTYHTMISLSFVLFIDYPHSTSYSRDLDRSHTILSFVQSRNSPALDSDKHFSSETECHLPSTVTYFVLDKSLFPTPTQIVKWGGSAETKDPRSVRMVKGWTADWEQLSQ